MARIVELIVTTAIRGSGDKGSPIRHIQQLWTKDGKLIAEYDPWPEGPNEEKSWYSPDSSTAAQV